VDSFSNPKKEHRVTLTTLSFQLGDPVEHRGIVITPLFPARDPVAGYITLDEALPRGLQISETSDAGSVPELAVVNPLDENVRLRGPGVIGSGLELDGEPIQLSAFTSSDDGQRAFGRIARPSRRR